MRSSESGNLRAVFWGSCSQVFLVVYAIRIRSTYQLRDIRLILTSQNKQICHLHISHDTPCLPPNILHSLCFFFSFLLGSYSRPKRNWKTILLQNFGGQTWCIMGDELMANMASPYNVFFLSRLQCAKEDCYNICIFRKQ